MTPQVKQMPRPTTLQDKKNIVVGLMSFPATIAQVFLRRKTGFRLLKPAKLLVLTAIMLGVGRISPPPDESAPAAAFFAPALPLSPQSSAPPGLDAPLPGNWPHLNSGTQAAWLGKHRLNAEQERVRAEREQAERERWQAEMEDKAKSAAQLAKLRAYLRGWPMYVFAMAFLIVGLCQRRMRWNALVQGEKWHTYSRGVSHLNGWVKRVLPETWVLRFADPLAAFVAGLCALLISRVLGLWLIFCALALFLVEQAVYEQALDRVLDTIDSLVDAEAMHEVITVFKKAAKGEEMQPGKSIEESGGVLSTSALIPQALRQRERRDLETLYNLNLGAESFSGDANPASESAPEPPHKANGSGLAASSDRL